MAWNDKKTGPLVAGRLCFGVSSASGRARARATGHGRGRGSSLCGGPDCRTNRDDDRDASRDDGGGRASRCDIEHDRSFRSRPCWVLPD